MSSKLTRSSHDRNLKQIRKNPFVFINSIAIFVSLSALILLLIFPFAVWESTGLIWYLIELKLSFTSLSWLSNPLRLLFSVFLLCLGMSIIFLLNSLRKVPFRFPFIKLGLIGFFLSFVAFILTLLLANDFVRHPIYQPRELSVCFYSSLICALLLMLLFLLQMTKNPLFETSANITQIVY